jgi:8-oxo-dGTP pyrophosphatase MutT (NUDIX family)
MSPYYANLRNQLGSRLILMPGVAGVMHDTAGRLLLQGKQDGTWSLPAGAIEPGETPQEAMARELQEETGLKAAEMSLIGCFGGTSFRHTYPNGHEVEYVILLFYCGVCTDEFAPVDPETVKLEFFARGDFPGLALPYPVDLLYSTVRKSA